MCLGMALTTHLHLVPWWDNFNLMLNVILEKHAVKMLSGLSYITIESNMGLHGLSDEPFDFVTRGNSLAS